MEVAIPVLTRCSLVSKRS